ncbi:hypothetical protein K7432_010660 [Basidiobolus ranarum]|uniref:Uncharacterized protein n=1 Tax=Basidiobolus ranarum TaxID=34480 RepID=A0ABR2WNL2_9FUNG
MEESPINKAHQHANAAEEFESRGLLEEAMQEHLSAAEHFELAIEFTSDAEVIRTLELLSSAHQRQGLEMERKINKNLLQKRTSNSHDENLPKASSTAKTLSALSSRYISNSTRFRSSHSHSSSISPSHMFDDSFLVLKSNIHDEENKSDPFDRFWEAVEALIQNTSNPIAFATAPLEGMERFDVEEIRGQYKKSDDHQENPNLHETLGSFIIVPEQSSKSRQPRKDPVESDSESPKIPSKSHPIANKHSNRPKAIGSTKTIEEYAIENQHLKKAIDILSRQVNALEKAAEENTLLKSSIIQLRQDLQKQAKKGRLAPELSRIYGSKYSTSESQHVGPNAHAATPQKKIQELEEEVRVLKLENDKQSMMLNKYRDRWDQLKESAKKKRSIAKTEQQQAADEFNNQSPMEEKSNSGKTPTVSFAPSPTKSIKSLDQSGPQVEVAADLVQEGNDSSPERNYSSTSEILSRSETAEKSNGSIFYSTSEDMKSSFP